MDAATNLPVSHDQTALPAWLKATVTLGVTSAISLGLVYWLAQSLSADVRATKALIEQHDAGQHTQRKLLYAICLGINRDNPDAKTLCEVGR